MLEGGSGATADNGTYAFLLKCNPDFLWAGVPRTLRYVFLSFMPLAAIGFLYVAIAWTFNTPKGWLDAFIVVVGDMQASVKEQKIETKEIGHLQDILPRLLHMLTKNWPDVVRDRVAECHRSRL